VLEGLLTSPLDLEQTRLPTMDRPFLWTTLEDLPGKSARDVQFTLGASVHPLHAERRSIRLRNRLSAEFIRHVVVLRKAVL